MESDNSFVRQLLLSTLSNIFLSALLPASVCAFQLNSVDLNGLKKGIVEV